MQRRQFLKSSVLLSAAGLVGPVVASQTVAQNSAPLAAPVMRRRFVLSQTYKLAPPQGSSGTVKLWIPLPVDTAFQQMTGLTFSGNYQQAYITTNNAYGAKTLFATWPKSDGDLLLQLDLEIETADWEPLKHEALKHWQAPEQIVYPLAVKPYLLPTTHTPVDGLVRETAQKITAGETDPLKKARLIYEWVSSHMERDNDVIGCGTGDVATILQSGKLSGKCTDISSVFVALARASGIPARELFGIRLAGPINWSVTPPAPSARPTARASPTSAAGSTAGRNFIWRDTAGCRAIRRTSPKCVWRRKKPIRIPMCRR